MYNIQYAQYINEICRCITVVYMKYYFSNIKDTYYSLVQCYI